ncbi:MAG: hypothetical protein ACTSQ8_21970, partial [Candidatus Helarchaeota archaeon]
NFDIFHFFWGESLYGVRCFQHLDLPLLKLLGKKIFVHFRGSDLVDPKHFDYLRAKTVGEDIPEPPISRPEQLTSLNKWRKYADKLLVSEPRLKRVAPEAVLVQQALKLDEWEPSIDNGRNDGAIRIGHAPTHRRKKGTEFVIEAIQSLQDEGLPVEMVLIENIPANDVKPLLESCDIIVDQVLYGWYGKVSIEAMALGKPAQGTIYSGYCKNINIKY